MRYDGNCQILNSLNRRSTTRLFYGMYTFREAHAFIMCKLGWMGCSWKILLNLTPPHLPTCTKCLPTSICIYIIRTVYLVTCFKRNIFVTDPELKSTCTHFDVIFSFVCQFAMLNFPRIMQALKKCSPNVNCYKQKYAILLHILLQTCQLNIDYFERHITVKSSTNPFSVPFSSPVCILIIPMYLGFMLFWPTFDKI